MEDKLKLFNSCNVIGTLKIAPVRQTPAANVKGFIDDGINFAATTATAVDKVENDRRISPPNVLSPPDWDEGKVIITTVMTASNTENKVLIRILSLRNTIDNINTTAGTALVISEAAIADVDARPYSKNTV